ncbi:MAG: hypothetical protein COA52_17145 [Hyphomicrobiales bacterium]|nr:hypothetical protein [Hyphomicrobiales bacterium]PCJ84643.1 MAG: hypothetical protein COA52_17145 [Hyphomicrobiales bacterium]
MILSAGLAYDDHSSAKVNLVSRFARERLLSGIKSGATLQYQNGIFTFLRLPKQNWLTRSADLTSIFYSLLTNAKLANSQRLGQLSIHSSIQMKLNA